MRARDRAGTILPQMKSRVTKIVMKMAVNLVILRATGVIFLRVVWVYLLIFLRENMLFIIFVVASRSCRIFAWVACEIFAWIAWCACEINSRVFSNVVTMCGRRSFKGLTDNALSGSTIFAYARLETFFSSKYSPKRGGRRQLIHESSLAHRIQVGRSLVPNYCVGFWPRLT